MWPLLFGFGVLYAFSDDLFSVFFGFLMNFSGDACLEVFFKAETGGAEVAEAGANKRFSLRPLH